MTDDFNLQSDSSFPSDGEAYYDPNIIPVPAKAAFPWKWILIGLGILAVVGLVVAGVLLLGPKIFVPPPEKTIDAYYQALNEKDMEKASSYVDGSAGIVITDLPFMDTIKQTLEQLVGDQLGTDIGIEMKFEDLRFTTTKNENNQATVEVAGQVRLTESITKIDLPIPYNWTHELIYRDGKWWIQP